MTLSELETLLAENSIAPVLVPIIASMALSPQVNHQENRWTISVTALEGIASPEQLERPIDLLRAILKSTILQQHGDRIRAFALMSMGESARGGQSLSYQFSSEFLRWAGLSLDAPSTRT